MSSTNIFTLLDQNDEDELHSKRLLNVEQNPFKRVQKRVLAPTNPIHEFLRRTPVDAADTSEITSDSEEKDSLSTLTLFQQSTIHDFSSLIHSLARLQFLLNSNAAERERYTSQASTITAQHATIRAETASLRTHLTQAREQLEIRKGYDVQAEKVLWVDGKVGGTKSKTREELGRESEKLRAEIEELEREGDELNGLWAERRAGLAEVRVQAGRLRRVVRGEVDTGTEADADEQRDEEEHDEENELDHDHDDHHLRPDSHHGDESSHVGTPAAHEGFEAGTPLPVIIEPDTQAMTPNPHPDEENEMEVEVSTPDIGSSLKHETQLDSSTDVHMDSVLAESSDAEMPDEAEKGGNSSDIE